MFCLDVFISTIFRPHGARVKGQLMVAIRILLRLFEINISITKA